MPIIFTFVVNAILLMLVTLSLNLHCMMMMFFKLSLISFQLDLLLVLWRVYVTLPGWDSKMVRGHQILRVWGMYWNYNLLTNTFQREPVWRTIPYWGRVFKTLISMSVIICKSIWTSKPMADNMLTCVMSVTCYKSNTTDNPDINMKLMDSINHVPLSLKSWCINLCNPLSSQLKLPICWHLWTDWSEAKKAW